MGLDKFSAFHGPSILVKKQRFSPENSLGAAPAGCRSPRAWRLSTGHATHGGIFHQLLQDALRDMLIAGLLIVALAATPRVGCAADIAATPEPPKRLPQRHAYQQTLYKFMATVTESDTAHGVTAKVEAAQRESADSAATGTDRADDVEWLYRSYLYTRMQQPLVGTKRGYPAVNASPACFTLPRIEQPDGVYYAPAWPEALVSFIQWRYPGNPYYGNRGLKMRAFMSAASNMMMFHEMLELTEGSQPPVLRPDQHGYNPVFWALPYPGFRDVLSDEIRQAYETGLRMIGERMLRWQPRGDGGGRDYILPVGLLHIARAIGDREFLAQVERHAKPLYSDPRFFHEAGYWDERGGIDTGFSGTANWFAVWTGLASDWPFVPETLDKVYRLRRHLLLPEPDGAATGPSHFNSRLGSPVNADQWHWDGVRDSGAAMLTDQALQFALRPTEDQLRQSPSDRARAFAFQLSEHGVENGKLITLEELQAGRKMPMKWVPRVWMTYNFPASVNPAYEFYRPGTWNRLQRLAAAHSPVLNSPYADGPAQTAAKAADNNAAKAAGNANAGGNTSADDQAAAGTPFTRVFGQDFVAARRAEYAAILHMGPVGRRMAGDERSAFPGPLGLGGGQLSAFWTPQTGSVLLGLRRGTSGDRSFDVLEEWRTWPTHVVAGRLASGLVVSSARCVDPRVQLSSDREIHVEGQLVGMETAVFDGPMVAPDQPRKIEFIDRQLPRPPLYRRSFQLDAERVRIESVVTGVPMKSASQSRIVKAAVGSGPATIVPQSTNSSNSTTDNAKAQPDVPADSLVELYEVLPVFLRHEEKQSKATPTAIEFARTAADGAEMWTAASDEPTAGVAAIRLSRFSGSVVIRFERPQRVVLSPTEWRDNWLNAGAASRNVLVDLLADSARVEPAKVDDAAVVRRVAYSIGPSSSRKRQ